MSNYRGAPLSPIENQLDMMKPHVTRGVSRDSRTAGERTLLLAVPSGWTSGAKCIGDFAKFDDTMGLGPGDAAARCAGCPVIEQCLSAAMEEEGDVSAGHRYGIRGGMSPKERAEYAAQLRPCGRGHTHQRVWQEVKNGRSYWRCAACTAEDSAARYGDPASRPALNVYQQKLRAQKRVCCLLCQTEMHSVSLAGHVESRHGEEVAA